MGNMAQSQPTSRSKQPEKKLDAKSADVVKLMANNPGLVQYLLKLTGQGRPLIPAR